MYIFAKYIHLFMCIYHKYISYRYVTFIALKNYSLVGKYCTFVFSNFYWISWCKFRSFRTTAKFMAFFPKIKRLSFGKSCVSRIYLTSLVWILKAFCFVFCLAQEYRTVFVDLITLLMYRLSRFFRLLIICFIIFSRIYSKFCHLSLWKDPIFDKVSNKLHNLLSGCS